MINPVHKVKRRVVYTNGRPPHWYEDSAVGWLTTGVKDCKGREIFEGNKIIFGELEKEGVIIFKDGAFGIAHKEFEKELFISLYRAKDFLQVEVVGHITEEEHHERN